jgi:hypothetical protein
MDALRMFELKTILGPRRQQVQFRPGLAYAAGSVGRLRRVRRLRYPSVV